MRLLSIGLLFCACAASAAEVDRLPKPSEIKELRVYPASLTIKGGDDAPQLVITGLLNDGKLVDLSGDAEFTVRNAAMARITKGGRVIPQTNGASDITISFGGKSAQIPIVAEHVGENLPINFANQVVPIFTKLGCNSGACHGKLSGQNGFKLSLLGFEPELDYTTLVKESRGRRLFPAAPERSLLLMKASGQMAHGGGRKLDPASEEFKVIRRWIASGTPYGRETDPVVSKITIYPEQRVLGKQDRMQVAVYAHYSDGTTEDITRRAQYESNEQDIAKVDENGLVSSFGLTGQAAIMARFQGNMTVCRTVIPLGVPIPAYTFKPANYIDKLARKKWQELGIAPSEKCSDEVFIRRVYLDISGTLPIPAQVLAFVADRSSGKRIKLVDALLETQEYSYYFANKWADILRVKRGANQNIGGRAFGTFAFHNWIRESIVADRPYDDFAREIIVAIGDENRNPPAFWCKDLLTPDQFVDNCSQVFLGLRMACANCHHHPYEKWSQDDYWGFAAFYSRVGRKTLLLPGQQGQGQGNKQVLYTMPNGSVVNKRSGKVAEMHALDGENLKSAPGTDPRVQLVDWMVNAKNPFFAKAVANRYWAHFLGRGVVDPLDDMRVTNPPSNPELLEALATDLVQSKYSLKHLIRSICTSEVYQLSSTPNDFNKHDKQSYARYYPKRMSAEVLFDAVSQVTDSPAQFGGIPRDRFAPNRALMLPDESYASYFLDVFGRPQRLSACECERVSEANLAQTLHLLNSDEVQTKLSRPGGRAYAMLKDERPDQEKMAELFLWCWGHKPTGDQLKLALENLNKHPERKREGYENVLWALINSKAFVFNQ